MSVSEKSIKDEKGEHVAVTTKEVDTGAQLLAGVDIELDEAEANRIRYSHRLHPCV